MPTAHAKVDLLTEAMMDVRRTARWYWGKLKRVDRPLKFIVNGQSVTVQHSGSIANRNAISQCFEDHQYEIPETGVDYRLKVRDLYARIVRDGGIPLIIDAGANIGASALWFRAQYPEAMIVAIEPATDNLKWLRVNCAGARFDIRGAAIGPEDGETTLTDPGAGADSYRTGGSGLPGYTVPVVSVATILAQHPGTVPFILKADIEGAEQHLFRGDPAVLAQFPIIAVEPHDWMLPGEGTALSFFGFHTAAKRDFSYHSENIFSLDYAKLAER